MVRTKLNELLELMNNEQRLAEERAKAVAEREKHERVQSQARSLQARVAASQGRPLTGAGVVSVVSIVYNPYVTTLRPNPRICPTYSHTA